MFAQTVIRALSRLGFDQRGMDSHPRQPKPMLFGKADEMFSSLDWTYEPKWDGFRVLASVRDDHVRLLSRTLRSSPHTEEQGVTPQFGGGPGVSKTQQLSFSFSLIISWGARGCTWRISW